MSLLLAHAASAKPRAVYRAPAWCRFHQSGRVVGTVFNQTISGAYYNEAWWPAGGAVAVIGCYSDTSEAHFNSTIAPALAAHFAETSTIIGFSAGGITPPSSRYPAALLPTAGLPVTEVLYGGNANRPQWDVTTAANRRVITQAYADVLGPLRDAHGFTYVFFDNGFADEGISGATEDNSLVFADSMLTMAERLGYRPILNMPEVRGFSVETAANYASVLRGRVICSEQPWTWPDESAEVQAYIDADVGVLALPVDPNGVLAVTLGMMSDYYDAIVASPLSMGTAAGVCIATPSIAAPPWGGWEAPL